MNPIVETMKTDRKYGGWLWALKLIGKAFGGWTDNTMPSPEHWRHFYDDGITPTEAMRIDINEGGQHSIKKR